MTSIAILIGVTDYDKQTNLPCCEKDLEAVKQLLEATKKFAEIKVFENNPASEIKDQLRSFINTIDSEPEEVFFYFSGHGIEKDDEFYFCMSDFEEGSPNTTGLSNQELHELIRPLKPAVFVKVIDACESGSQLIKSVNLNRYEKGSFKSFIQMAACQNDQAARTGVPLSLFTERFISATLAKDKGPVYYTDIKENLRDSFSKNNFQTPYFIDQGTAREIFVNDASLLDSLRKKSGNILLQTPKELDNNSLLKTLSERLEERELGRANQEVAQKYIETTSEFISDLTKLIPEVDAAYDLEIRQSNDYYHDASKLMIVPILEREPRTDRLVKASIGSEDADSFGSSLGRISALAGTAFASNKQKIKTYNLALSCSLKRVQWVFDFLPKFESLQKFSLTVSYIPSYPTCYVFSVIERKMMTNWGTFGEHADIQSKKWFKGDWSEPSKWIAEQISDQLAKHAKDYFESEGLGQSDAKDTE